MKLFISQPMNGKTNGEIINERINAINKVKEKFVEDVDVIDSYFEDYPESNVKNKGLWYLGKSLMKLAEADVAYFVGDWKKYRGCRIENTCAKEYGIEVIEE